MRGVFGSIEFLQIKSNDNCCHNSGKNVDDDHNSTEQTKMSCPTKSRPGDTEKNNLKEKTKKVDDSGDKGWKHKTWLRQTPNQAKVKNEVDK